MALIAAMVVHGLDLSALETAERIVASQLDEYAWSAVDGRVVVEVPIPEDLADPVCFLTDVAHAIEHALGGVQVRRVDDDLVSITDIAERLGFARETVRLWANGQRGTGDFPIARGTVGGGIRGGTRVWAWADVADWFQRTYDLIPEDSTLSPTQVAELNAHLARARDVNAEPWRAATMDTADMKYCEYATVVTLYTIPRSAAEHHHWPSKAAAGAVAFEILEACNG